MFDVIFFLLTFLAFIGLIIGLIKPDKVIRWGEKKTRKQVALVYGIAILVFFILFAITIPPSEKKGETKPEITQSTQETKKQSETGTIILLDSGGKIVPVIVGISPKEFDEKGKRFLISADLDGLTDFTEKYSIDIPTNTKATPLGEEIQLEPDLDLGRKQIEFFVKIKILEGSYKDKIGWVNRSLIKIVSLPQETQKQSEKETKTDSQTYSTVIDKIETYKLPVKSGVWQTCIIESINALNNVQLLLFQEWLYSLSSYASEETNLVAIARKLGCPEPTITIIPAKIEIIKSWQGTGSKNLSSFTPNTAEWTMKISWQNSPFNEDFGDDEFAIERRMLFDYGIVDYEEGASITSSPLISAFYTPSGNEERDSGYLGYKHFDILRVKAPEQATWKIEIYKIIEPERRIIE